MPALAITPSSTLPLIMAIKLGNLYTVCLLRPHPLQNFSTPSRSLLEFLYRQKSTEMCLVCRLLLRTAAHHRTDSRPPGASCELPPSRGPSPSHQITSQTWLARRTSFPQQTFTAPACHPFFVKSYKGIVFQVAPSITPYRSLKISPLRNVAHAWRQPQSPGYLVSPGPPS